MTRVSAVILQCDGMWQERFPVSVSLRQINEPCVRRTGGLHWASERSQRAKNSFRKLVSSHLIIAEGNCYVRRNANGTLQLRAWCSLVTSLPEISNVTRPKIE